MKQTIFILMLMWAGLVSAQITGAATNFNYGIKLPNATNEGDTLSFSTKIPIMDNLGGINYFANLSDLDGMFGATWGGITGTLSDQTDLQNALDLKLNSSEYTAADVLAKLLTVDGSGSGLDADLLRGVHWGNVNTNIVTSGIFTSTGVGNSSTVGNLGVGYNTPIYRLDVREDDVTQSAGTGAFRFAAVSNYGISKNLFYHRQDDNSVVINEDAADLDFRIEGVSQANLFRIDAGNSRVGIGTASPSSTLDVNGNITATNFILSSDKRLKENFIDLGNGYYSFNFKGSNEKRYGVIAQEVKEYAPELVSEGEDGYLKVAYIDLLIKKQAEQEKRITYLWIVIGVLSLGVGYSILKK